MTSELIERCKAGDQAAWNRLVETTYREVYTLCLRILGDPDDAAEATQDAYLKVWRGLGGFRGDSQFSTWLYRVAANAALSKHRGRKRRRTHETGSDDDALHQVAATGSLEGAVEARLDVRTLEAVIGQIPQHYRDAVVLRDVYDFSIAEIASQLSCSETAAKVRVHRGRKMLKKLVYPSAGTEKQEG